MYIYIYIYINTYTYIYIYIYIYTYIYINLALNGAFTLIFLRKVDTINLKKDRRVQFFSFFRQPEKT